ncbi:hypothetical protein [Halobaculum sp. MBLA0143]|uniref:hypothetical protein n=1 Tax=Halobaculum sp. MBLA0143 TaxID=3079933 RepID=UPI0035234C2D
MRRREFLRSAACTSTVVTSGCAALARPPISVESVKTTVEDKMNIHVLVTISNNKEFNIVEKRLQARITKDEERIAFESYKEDIIGTSFSENKSFLIVGVDGELPIQPDDYTAFGRIRGQEWVKAQHVDSI